MYDNQARDMKRLMRKISGSYCNILENVIWEYHDERDNENATFYDKELIRFWKIMFFEDKNSRIIKHLFEGLGEDKYTGQYLSKRAKYKAMVLEELTVR